MYYQVFIPDRFNLSSEKVKDILINNIKGALHEPIKCIIDNEVKEKEKEYFVISYWGSEISYDEFKTKEETIKHAHSIFNGASNIIFIKGNKVELTLEE